MDGEEGTAAEGEGALEATTSPPPPPPFADMPGTVDALDILGSIPSVGRAPLPARAAPAGAEPAAAWDLRHGALPGGLEVMGGESEFVSQQDGSTALRLQPMSYLKVQSVHLSVPACAAHDLIGCAQVNAEALSGMKGADGKLLNQYTLTMDIYIEKLPDHPVSLYQALGESSCVS